LSRLAFFLGVFSVGLVVFLFLTGQFSISDENPDGVSPIEPIETTDLNRVTHHSYDYALGRLRFTLRGEVDLTSGLVLSPENLVSQRDLISASIEMPVYAEGRTDPVDQILIRADRIITDPGGQQAEVVGQLHAIGAGGSPQLTTRDMRFRWADGEDIRIQGSSAVQVAWPALELRGANGLDGSIGSGTGLNSLRFSPPLIIAVKGNGSEGETGLEGHPGRQIRILCNGPMTLEGAQKIAHFEGGVQIFESDPDAPLDPTLAAPQRHIYADFLDLHLEPTTRRLVKIEARRRDHPVTIHLGGGIRVEGERLDWSEGESQIRLSEGIVIHSEVGTFHAMEATVLTGESRCIVSGGVTGSLRSMAISSGTPDPEAESNWSVEAESAEFHFDEGQLLSLTARGKSGESVSIREQRQGGARIVGDELWWRAEEGQLEVLSSEGSRARFSEGKNHIEADSAALSIGSPRLVFRGGVTAELVELPQGPSFTTPRWLGEDPLCQVIAQQMTLLWDGKQRLKQLDAQGGESPLELLVLGTEKLQLIGDRLQWRGVDGQLTLTGEDRQKLTIGDRAELIADRLSMSMSQNLASGEGSVVGTVSRPGDDEQPIPVTILCDSVVVSLAPDEQQVTPDDARSSNPSAAGSIIGVRALSGEDGRVQIEDGTFRARCDELLWDAEKQRYRFQGKGLQQVEIAAGGATPDRIEAETITLDPIQGTAELVGDARARVYLGNASADGVVETIEKMAWNLESDRIDAKLDLSGDQIRLVEVSAAKNVRLHQQEGGIEFRGQHCRWDQQQQRLILSSVDGQGLQTFVRGDGPQDEVVAREVVVVRSTSAGPGSPERLEVLLSSVLSATFQMQGTAEDEPGQFEMRADELLLVLKETAESGSLSPHEVLAWGSTDLRGGPYRILAERARVLIRNRSVELEGGDNQPVQVLRDGTSDLPPSRSVKLTWGPRGYRVQNLPRGGGWSIRDVDSALERMDRSDHGPEPR
jgi:lipopolysaccharide export system protein LptA